MIEWSPVKRAVHHLVQKKRQIDVSTAPADYEDGSRGLVCLNAWSSVELFGKD